MTLAETFIDNDFDLSGVFHDLIKFVCPAVKLSYRGRRSGGLLVMVKKQLAKFTERISVDCENLIVLKFSGALLATEEDYFCLRTCRPVVIDFMSLQSQVATLQKLNNASVNVNLICNGDFNARTATYQVNQDNPKTQKVTRCMGENAKHTNS